MTMWTEEWCFVLQKDCAVCTLCLESVASSVKAQT